MRGAPLVVFVGAALLCSCNRGSPEPASVNVVRSAASKAEDRAATRPRQIYYDLTHYGWYQRAEPLVFGQQRYVPRGAPIVIPLAKLRLTGNYQGVDFYVLQAETEPPSEVYVPVYEEYWLPFIAAPATSD